jgi:N-methylhydantoinase A
MRYLGVDTGGTFTDLVQIDADGKISFEKAFSTPRQPADGVLDVLAQLARTQGESLRESLQAVGRFAHGTTVSTNALIQRRGARVGLLVTHGFEDTLYIARGPIGRTGGLPPSQALDFLHTPVPEPLVPKHLTEGLHERVTVTRQVLAPLDSEEVRPAIRRLIDRGAESLAVCLLWSFRNPVHEQMVKRIAAEMAPDMPISLSSEIAPRIGEFERLVTTVVNAFIGPITERYIGSLQRRLAENGLEPTLQVMKSSGGVTVPARVATEAVSIINSGPIGGLIAARHVGKLLGFDNIITADMGGTSFDVGLIGGGVFEEQRTPFIDQGLPVHVPAIKVVSIGAGGGSIAWTDGHHLHVGPQSAGSDPGPVAYRRGGTQPTVTDALVALGIIDPRTFFGGRLELDKEAALAAIEKSIAEPLGMSAIDAATGIYEVVTATMADLIRKATVESGNDPKQFCLLAYGGAAGAHCAAFSGQLGIRKVVIPYAAPVFSAFGCAFSDVLCSHSKSEPVRLDASPQTLALIADTFAELESRVLADKRTAGFAADELIVRYKIDLRYEGQMNEVSLDWGSCKISAADVASLREAFERLYQQKFGAGTTHSKSALELINFRAEAVKEVPKPVIAPIFSDATSSIQAPGGAGLRRSSPRNDETHSPKTTRPVYQHRRGWLKADIYDFDRLTPGRSYAGPAVIQRQSTTVWLPPGSAAVLDVYGNIEITPEG